MAAHEDQPELVLGRGLRGGEVAIRVGAGSVEFPHRARLLGLPPRFSTHLIQGLVPRGGDQPRPRIGRCTGGRPLGQRRGAGLLYGVVRGRQVPHDSGDAGDRGPPVLAQLALDHRRIDQDDTEPAEAEGAAVVVGAWVLMTGRTSTDPALAAGIIAANFKASSRSAHSTRV